MVGLTWPEWFEAALQPTALLAIGGAIFALVVAIVRLTNKIVATYERDKSELTSTTARSVNNANRTTELERLGERLLQADAIHSERIAELRQDTDGNREEIKRVHEEYRAEVRELRDRVMGLQQGG